MFVVASCHAGAVSSSDVPEGFYDALVTRALQRQIDLSGLDPTLAAIESAELADVLAHHVRRVSLASSRCLLRS